MFECILTGVLILINGRDAVLDIVLQIAEALSLSDEFASQLASNQKLFSLACQVIHLSHKDEVR